MPDIPTTPTSAWVPGTGDSLDPQVVHTPVDNLGTTVDSGWALVVCAHGTDDPAGQQTTRDITAAVAGQLPGVPVSCAHVDVQQPSLDDEVRRLVDLGHRVAIVPVLLTTGFHVRVDVARAVAAHPGRVVSSGPLGPHSLLVKALRDRLQDAGVGPDTRVVVAVAGSRRPEARAAALQVGEDLACQWQAPVGVGFLAAAEPSLRDAVAAARHQAMSVEPTDAGTGGQPAHGDEHQTRVAVASYLIGPGVFHRQACSVGADVVTAPLGDHPALVELVVRRFGESVAAAG